MGSVFLKMEENTAAFFSRGGVLFLSVISELSATVRTKYSPFDSALLFSALTAMAEIPALYAQRPIVLRHEHAALYHPFIEALALTLVDAPITLGIMIVFAIILYFMVGLQRSAVSTNDLPLYS